MTALREFIGTFLVSVWCAEAIRGLSGSGQGGKTVEKQSTSVRYSNRLINETSPYLLQHAHNPVDWYPWGDAAFERARKEDKPIFLSIGYSTCHWCHVMERESFADEQIAKVMNEHFVSIKVDREQRPDVDAVYMNAVQMMTGSGGWPLSVFLTPEGKPFYGGTYFPPNDAYGRPSFEKMLLAVARAWKDRRAELVESAGKISGVLAGLSGQARQETLSGDSLTNAYSYFESVFDSAYGGFGGAPKFPQPSNLSMLLGYWQRTDEPKALVMVETTLDAMAKGGIYDHIGGGFHRYSTDAKWLVPHFEKMLYDQALLSRVYIQAYQATGKEDYARVAREVFEYVRRDMTAGEGGFYSAEDADSEGKEGLFYIWEPNQIENVLGREKGSIFSAYYGVNEKGNFEDNSSILNVTASAGELARRLKKEGREIEGIVAEGRSRLLEHRGKRIRPHRDDKVIAGWNGLMVSSLAYGGAVLEERKYVIAAERAVEFVLNRLRRDGRLMRYYRGGKAVGPAFLDDYAFMIMGLLDLYEATFDVKWLLEARNLAERMVEQFGDESGGGFFLAGKDGKQLFAREKPGYDGAVPSGNSIAALVLLRLGRFTAQEQFTERGKQVLEAFSAQLSKSPASSSAMLTALDFRLGPTQEIVIAGDSEQAGTKEMLKLVRSKFLPNAVILFHGAGESGSAIERINPFLKGQAVTGGRATAYVCENYVCRKPVSSVSQLKTLLDSIVKDGGSGSQPASARK
ncbi:MAG TPA: thioredoxin domain-containing protein [Sedimentisphaerales bacterium]|nr:thioredoxin domain-containing protein [Sedimentisphaerales bacterium]